MNSNSGQLSQVAVPVASRHAAPQPVPASQVRANPIYAEVAVTIRRPRTEVAAVMFDPRRDTAWIARLRHSAAGVPGPLAAGMTVTRQWQWLRRRLAEVSDVAQHTPGRVLELATQLPFALRIRYELEGIPEGTIARIRLDGSASGALRFATPLIDWLLRRAVVGDLQRLKALLEAGTWRSPAN